MSEVFWSIPPVYNKRYALENGDLVNNPQHCHLVSLRPERAGQSFYKLRLHQDSFKIDEINAIMSEACSSSNATIQSVKALLDRVNSNHRYGTVFNAGGLQKFASEEFKHIVLNRWLEEAGLPESKYADWIEMLNEANAFCSKFHPRKLDDKTLVRWYGPCQVNHFLNAKANLLSIGRALAVDVYREVDPNKKYSYLEERKASLLQDIKTMPNKLKLFEVVEKKELLERVEKLTDREIYEGVVWLGEPVWESRTTEA